MSHAQMFVVNCNDDVTLDKLMVVGRLFLFWKKGKIVCKTMLFFTKNIFEVSGTLCWALASARQKVKYLHNHVKIS